MHIINIEEEIFSLEDKGNYKPHKHIALLTLVHYLKSSEYESNRITYDDRFKQYFTFYFEKYSRDNDRNRPYNPFFHLRTMSFWELIPNKGYESAIQNKSSVSGPSELQKMVSHVVLKKDFMELLRNSEKRIRMLKKLTSILDRYKNEYSSTIKQSTKNIKMVSVNNNFVFYLNTLISINTCNENALAENQFCNPMFSNIHTAHPLTEVIYTEFSKSLGKTVILTGNAGDGKTTIAVDLFRNLKGISDDETLSQAIRPREDIPEKRVTIIKDFSERKTENDDDLINELKAMRSKFLIVSNTGTLLNFFTGNFRLWGLGDRVTAEKDILDAISDERGVKEIKIGGVEFIVYNLSRMDNLGLAERIFEKMLHKERWEDCESCDRRVFCPIIRNVRIVQSMQNRVVSRLFLAYRKMYEYGIRFTLRQLTGHLAYIITSNTDCYSISKNMNSGLYEYLFFNRFFGDNGKEKDVSAEGLKVVYEIQKQELGLKLSTETELLLWLHSKKESFTFHEAESDNTFKFLRKIGRYSDFYQNLPLKPEQARQQVRRMLYFCYDFSRESSFIKRFLNSDNIVEWHNLNRHKIVLDIGRYNLYRSMIFHVIQEHFTGLKLPEGTKQDGRIYLTLNRGSKVIRQSSQIIICTMDWNTSTRLELIEETDAANQKRMRLLLKGLGLIEGIDLDLGLPFLDYVTMRHYGELGEVLHISYRERLDKYKALIQDRLKNSDDTISVLRLKSDYSFRKESYVLIGNRLEVYNVL